jgi:ribosomal protein L29
MPVETPHLASLRAKLKARTGKKEYEKNCEEIRKEIARLENCQDLDL